MPAENPIDVAVVVPLTDEHGLAEACLAGWNAQAHPRERLQLVVVDPGEDSTAEARLRPLLRPWDGWLSVASSNEAVLCGAGARAADAPFLIFTEAHCVPLPAAAAAVVSLLSRGDVAVAAIASGHLPTTRFGERQSELERSWFRALAPDHWRRLSLRGMGISRELYLSLGGFRAEYERFAETALGADLYLAGHRIAGTELLLLHGNAPTAADLEAALASCGRGQWRWREQLERTAPGLADELLGPPLVGHPRRVRVAAARRSWSARRAILRGDAWRRLAVARAASRALLRAGWLGGWAYRAHWRAACRRGLVEALTEERLTEGRQQTSADAPWRDGLTATPPASAPPIHARLS